MDRFERLVHIPRFLHFLIEQGLDIFFDRSRPVFSYRDLFHFIMNKFNYPHTYWCIEERFAVCFELYCIDNIVVCKKRCNGAQKVSKYQP